MTIRGDFKISINASPEAVWTFLGDVSRHVDWSPKPYRVALISGDANSVGSKYESFGWVPGDKDHRNECQIVESVPNARLVLNAIDPQGIFKNTYVLTSSGSATIVDYSLEFPKLSGVTAILAPIAFPLVGKADIRKRLNLLKAKAESLA